MADTQDNPLAQEAPRLASWDQWMSLSAQLLHLPLSARARLVRQSGIGDAWERVDRHYSDQLFDDLSQGRMDRVQRYLTVCSDQMASRQAYPPPPVVTPTPPLHRGQGAPMSTPSLVAEPDPDEAMVGKTQRIPRAAIQEAVAEAQRQIDSQLDGQAEDGPTNGSGATGGDPGSTHAFAAVSPYSPPPPPAHPSRQSGAGEAAASASGARPALTSDPELGIPKPPPSS